MVVEADDALDGAREQFVFRVDARGLAQDLDVETFVFKVSEVLGQFGREVDLFFDAADHDADRVRPGERRHEDGRRRERGREREIS